MAEVTPAEAKRRLNALARELDKAPTPIGSMLAQAVLAGAVRRASRHPTPQARMAASAAYAKGNVVRVAARKRVYGHGGSALAGKIVRGSEFGTIGNYPQFRAPHTRRGYWLYPAAEEPNLQGPLNQVDQELQTLLDSVASFGGSVQTLEGLIGRVVRATDAGAGAL